MKVVLIGVHGAGKTTLCELLSERLKLPIFPEHARFLLDVSKKDWREMSASEWLMFESSTLFLISEQYHAGSFVADRTVLDPIGYLSVYAPRFKFALSESVLHDKIISIANSFVDRMQGQIDWLIYLKYRGSELENKDDKEIGMLDEFFEHNVYRLQAKKLIVKKCREKSAEEMATEIANEIK